MNFLKSNKLVRLSALLFLISIPFNTRKFLHSFTPQYNEVGSVFFHASDAFLIIFIAAFLIFLKFRPGVLRLPKKETIFLGLFVAIVGISALLASYKLLAGYQFIRVALFSLSALILGALIRKNILNLNDIALTIGFSALFQSFVAFLQFKNQESVGLSFLGESFVDPITSGVAKIVVQGGRLLRSYGTLPHANILAGFLILGLLSFVYLLFKSRNRLQRIAFSVFVFSTLIGLVLTFSRSGWIVAFFAVTLFMIFGFLNNDFRKSAVGLFVILAACCALLIATMGWAVFPRASLTLQEPSVSHRWIYNLIGFDVIQKNIFGVGIGNQLLYSINQGQFQEHDLTKPWSWQPVHNLYILIASEVGLPGFLVFSALVFRLAANSWRKKFNLEVIAVFAMFSSLLLFGLFDHFLWDLQSGELMLWTTLGIMMGLAYHEKPS